MTIYDGDAGNIALASPINIASSTNANPIVVTTASPLPADFLTGITVTIRGHSTNTAANGTWRATVTGGSSFSIPTTGNGVGSGDGVVQPLNLPPAFSVPQDGDACNNASIVSEFQLGGGDRSAFLAARTGAYKFAGICRYVFSPGAFGTPYASLVGGVFTSNTWTAITGSPVALTQWGAAGCLSAAQVVPPYGVSGFQSGDIAHVTYDTGFAYSASGLQAGLRIGLYAQLIGPGGTLGAFPTGWTLPDAGSTAVFVDTGPEQPIHVDVWLPLNLPAQNILFVQPALYVLNAVTATVSLLDATALTFECWRATGMVQ